MIQFAVGANSYKLQDELVAGESEQRPVVPRQRTSARGLRSTSDVDQLE